ncbi:hypothetical protein N7523_003207 [Penicillium sp. IBT 18751x]|nr:hypothetical protein N7523_003207 [Penicillium sp. IBT 18751x]
MTHYKDQGEPETSTTGPPDNGEAINSNEKSRGYNVLILGASYAGMAAASTLLALKEGRAMPLAAYGKYTHLKQAPRMPSLKLTLLDERDGFFHTVGTPLAHISTKQAAHMWKLYSGFSRLERSGVNFIRGSAVQLDAPRQNLRYRGVNGTEHFISYDYLLVATGMRREWPVVPRSSSFSGYFKDAVSSRNLIAAAEKLGVAVIGGGAVGVEFAGKIKQYYPQSQVTLIHSQDQLLKNEPLPDEFKTQALKLLQEQGIRVIFNQRPTVTQVEERRFEIRFADGKFLLAMS